MNFRNFRQYLETQPLERQRELRAAERRYLDSRRVEDAPDGFSADPVERAYLDSMEGYCEPPAGPTPRHRREFATRDDEAQMAWHSSQREGA
jgi:hypothetical protein